MKMGWLTRRRIKKFIENPDKYLVVNPRFCEHIILNGVCNLCGIKEEIVNFYYWTWQDAFDNKKENEVITYNKKLGMYGLDNTVV